MTPRQSGISTTTSSDRKPLTVTPWRVVGSLGEIAGPLASAAAPPGAGDGRGHVPRVGPGEVRAGRDDVVDGVEQLVVEADLVRAELTLEVLHRARPDDGRRDARVLQHEGQ